MHDLRSAILSGEGVRPDTPIASKAAKAAPVSRSLTAIRVKREESRLTDQRTEERHREIVSDATITFRRRKRDVRVINVSPGGVMIEADIEPRIGESVDVQFADCNRTKSIVRWIRGNRIGLEFGPETAIIGSNAVQDFIIRQLRGADASELPTGAKSDRAPRHSLIWMGTVHFNHDSYPARVRNISSQGAMLEVRHRFSVGAEVLVDLEEGGTVFAKVRWAQGGQIGVRFDTKFDLRRLANATPLAVPAKMVKPTYLQSDGSADSPWFSAWDRLTLDELTETLGKRPAEKTL